MYAILALAVLGGLAGLGAVAALVVERLRRPTAVLGQPGPPGAPRTLAERVALLEEENRRLWRAVYRRDEGPPSTQREPLR
jgi:hypothetical protein